MDFSHPLCLEMSLFGDAVTHPFSFSFLFVFIYLFIAAALEVGPFAHLADPLNEVVPAFGRMLWL